YYPINARQKINWLKRRIIFDIEEQKIIPICLKIIDDFKPDIIQVFGSENCFGLLAQYTDIPVVIHIQGVLYAYAYAYFPPGYNNSDYLLYNNFNILDSIRQVWRDKIFRIKTKREKRILESCRYYIGRTNWDKCLTQLYNQESIYYHCNETLRNEFSRTENIWQIHNRDKIILISVISPPLYKGIDLIIKTAKILTENTNINFE
ncbi:hypothetical protein, partial [Treponema endosymbiont of Eucomonympha sp.]|uniref:hypothetical protein n=1 Tax=Treponema endosymbiont of Eucomonympha sp. TaxID=1580831 RepID=UPI000AFA85D1